MRNILIICLIVTSLYLIYDKVQGGAKMSVEIPSKVLSVATNDLSCTMRSMHLSFYDGEKILLENNKEAPGFNGDPIDVNIINIDDDSPTMIGVAGSTTVSKIQKDKVTYFIESTGDGGEGSINVYSYFPKSSMMTFTKQYGDNAGRVMGMVMMGECQG